MKYFVFIFALMILSACGIKSEQSLIDRSEGITMLPSHVALVSPKALANPAFHLKRDGNVYSIIGDDDFSEAVFAEVPGNSGYYAVQLTAKDGNFQQALVRIRGRSLEMQNIDTEKMVEEQGVRGIGELGDAALVSRRSQLNMLYVTAIEFNTKEATIYKIYDLGNTDQMAELLAVSEEMAQAKNESSSAASAAEALNPDLWKNDWETLTPGVRNLVDALPPIDGQIDIARDVEGDMLKLSWYENTYLIRLSGGWTPNNLFFYFLYDGGGELVRLNGTSPNIHSFNRRNPIILNDETIKPYLWFFTFFVRGEDGPFLLVQNSNDTFIPKANNNNFDTNTLNALTRFPRPAICETSSGQYAYKCSAVVYYSNAMFEAEFGIEASGMTGMIDDTAIAADLEVKVDAPIAVSQVNGSVTALSSNASVLQGLSGVPNTYQETLEEVAQNKVISLNRTNLPFFAGLGAVLANGCGLPHNASQRGELLAFSMSASSNIIFGMDYSNPNLGDAMQSMISNSALFAAGSEVAKQLSCDSGLAENIAQGILKSLQASENRDSDGRSQFVRTCSPTFDERRCNCLAQQGRSVIPNIHSMSYNRGIIADIIQRNPMVGLQIAFMCGISNY